MPDTELTDEEKKEQALLKEGVLPLVAIVDDELIGLGTAFVLHPNGLLMTAAHVIRSPVGRRDKNPGERSQFFDDALLFAMFVSEVQFGASPESPRAIAIPVAHTWTIGPHSDIALMQLRLRAVYGDVPVLRSWKLSPGLPAAGDEVTAIGYHSHKGQLVQPITPALSANFSVNTTTRPTKIVDLHPEKRDNGLITFPSFSTTVPFESGMSGGPIINVGNNVVGVISTGSSFGAGGYGALLWSAMIIPLTVKRSAATPTENTILYELARTGYVECDGGLKDIGIRTGPNGNLQVGIEIPPHLKRKS